MGPERVASAPFNVKVGSTWPSRIALTIGTLVALAAMALGIALLLWPTSVRTHQLKLVTDIEPHRNLMAKKIADEGRNHHLDITLSAKNQGALAALEAAESSTDAKLAMVPGGITNRDYRRVRLVTTLTNEPLHVMVRPELVEGGLPALRGRRVNLGPDTTASHHLARGVLAFVGLMPTHEPTAAGYVLDATPQETLIEDLDRIESMNGTAKTQALSKFPDAVVFLAPLPSHFAKRLVTVAGFQLMGIPFADAFCVEKLMAYDAGGVRIDRSVMGTVVIPPYTYGGNPPVPVQPTTTLAVPLLLIAQEDTDPEAVMRLLETIHDSPLKNVIHPPPLAEQAAALPFHLGAEKFLKRKDPYLSPELTAKIGSVTGGIISFVSGIIGFVTFLRVMKLRRFERHYRELSRLQLMARGQLAEPGCPDEDKARRAYLDTRLAELQSRVFRNFAGGGLRGESQLADINAMINDLRNSLAQNRGLDPAPTVKTP